MHLLAVNLAEDGRSTKNFHELVSVHANLLVVPLTLADDASLHGCASSGHNVVAGYHAHSDTLLLKTEDRHSNLLSEGIFNAEASNKDEVSLYYFTIELDCEVVILFLEVLPVV